MQFKVPQDVLRADKIVGFLTLRQLVIVGVGGGLSYSLYIILSKQYLIEVWLIPVAFTALVTLAFAFFKFHDIVFEKLALVFIEYKFLPRARTWQKMKGDVVLSVLSNPIGFGEKKATKAAPLTEQERRKKLEEAMKAVDRKKVPSSNIQKSNIPKTK